MTVWAAQWLPASAVVMTRPKSPTATQKVVLVQLMLLTPAARTCWLHVEPPLTVVRIGLSCPAAKQVLAAGQLIAVRRLPLGLGFCQLQLPPVVRAGLSCRGDAVRGFACRVPVGSPSTLGLED
ncbi:MAG TPA: hypothetical protein DCF65_14700 [Chloroflexi bacterium]|nr:hypothetical protein [Chloroflexota bacterium]